MNRRKSHDWLKTLVYGVGINDATYVVNDQESGIQIVCPFYQKWHSMIRRCYSGKDPSYYDCYVCDEWKSFMNFRRWMERLNWEGKELDKDLLCPGNRVYGPENCLFVTREVNTFINENAKIRGLYPIGVYLDKVTGRYKSQISVGAGKRKHLGRFETVDAAAEAYARQKKILAFELSKKQDDIRVAEAIIKRYA